MNNKMTEGVKNFILKLKITNKTVRLFFLPETALKI